MLVKRGGIDTAIGHWAQLMEGLHESPQHFYEAVTAAIEKREVPDCRIKRVYWQEGGLFSARRLYLRAKRAGYLIDICGAPFGNAFFASSWLCAPPPRVILAILLAIVGFYFTFTSVDDLIGMNPIRNFNGPPWVHQRIIEDFVTLGLAILFVVIVSIFGIIRPLFFAPRLTYYRYDTAEMFYRAIQNAVTEVIQGLRAEQGLRLLTEGELKPIMRGFGR
jgi:hypothetical protein